MTRDTFKPKGESLDRGEAVSWECRIALRDGTFGEWHKCLREQYDSIRLTGHYNGPGGAMCEARVLYAATPPSPAESADKPLLFDGFSERGIAATVRRAQAESAAQSAPVAAPDGAPSQVSGAVEHIIKAHCDGMQVCCGRGNSSSYNEPPECCGQPDDLGALLRAAMTQPQPGRVEGMVLVPMVPTAAMIDAALAGIRSLVVRELRTDELRRNWKAMLAAAPATDRGEQAHQWDGAGERCMKCGDKDWMGGPCTTEAPTAGGAS